MIKILPPQNFLRACFVYDSDTGKMFWKKRPLEHFPHEKEWRRWNTRYAGAPALDARKRDKIGFYFHGKLDGCTYTAHRVIWKWVTGEEPPDLIDHVDQDKTNNRWDNLRAASQAQNFINRTASWGQSGVIGIKPHGSRWVARIHKDKKYVHLGVFASKEDAMAARRQAELELYGEFAP